MREAVTRIWLRVNALLRRRQLDRDLDDELAFHLAMRGDTPDARRRFGNVTLWKERTRELWTFAPLETLAQDLRYAWRLLRRNPGVSTVAILSLALGIGANTAIFSLMNAVLWKMLPVREPQRLVQLAYTGPRGLNEAFPYTVYEQLRDRSEVFSGMVAFSGDSRWSLGAGGHAELVVGQMVSGTFHSVLGVNAQAGRTLTPEDDRTQGAHPVAVISDGYWSRRFGRDPSAIGMAITINGRPFTVVGVTPRGFFGVSVGSRPDITVPVAMDAAITGRESNLKNAGFSWLHIFARLKPETTATEALAGTRVAYRQITDAIAARTTDPQQLRDLHGRTMELRSASQGLDRMRRRFSMPLGVLAAMVGLTLLIACLNIANLLLARASARRREMAMRLAIGASRGRLIRQLLTESTLLAVAGGALGLVMAQWSGSALLRLASGSDPISIDLPADLRVFAFTAVVAVATGVLCGLAPAMLATRRGRGPAAIDGHLRGPHRSRLSKALVVLQVAVSVLLLVGAGLFVRTLQNLNGVDTGFDRDNLIVFAANPVLAGQTRERAGRFSVELADRLDAIPGVHAAALSLFGLMEGNGWTTRAIVPGFTPPSEHDAVVELNLVGPRFFDTVGMALAAGVPFAARDFRVSPGVVVINQTMARDYFFNQNPLGRTVTINGAANTVIGIVKDAKSYGRTGHSDPQGVPAVSAGRGAVFRPDVLRRARRRRRGTRDGANPRGGRGARSERAAVQDEHHERADRPVARTGTPDRHAGRVFRRAGAAAGVRRALRADVVCGRAADEGDRHPPGARRAARHGAPRRHPRDAAARRRRHRARRAGGRGGRAARRRPAVRALAAGSGDVGRCRGGDDDGRDARRVPAGPPGLRGPADGGASSRVRSRRPGRYGASVPGAPRSS